MPNLFSNMRDIFIYQGITGFSEIILEWLSEFGIGDNMAEKLIQLLYNVETDERLDFIEQLWEAKFFDEFGNPAFEESADGKVINSEMLPPHDLGGSDALKNTLNPK